jgi:hypothetical protein
MKCRHCKNSKVNRPRGLCWSCYYKPGVREMFPSTSKFARRGLGQLFCNAPVPAAATNAMPGTEDKIAVLAQRVQNQESLWHPQDAGFEMAETMHCQAC